MCICTIAELNKHYKNIIKEQKQVSLQLKAKNQETNIFSTGSAQNTKNKNFH
jgi:hypothetical protein